jgi:hypothetical protein
VAGIFNNHYTGDPNHRLEKISKNRYIITLQARIKEIEFKFTRGGWHREDGDNFGNKKISHRRYVYGTAGTIDIFIPGWIDLLDKEL